MAAVAIALALLSRKSSTEGVPIHLLPNDPTIYFSPYAWALSPSNATTVNTGSYFKTLFTGNAINVTFDVAEMVNPVSQIYWQIDNGPMTRSLVVPVLTLTVPSPLTQGDVPYHLLTVLVKSTTERANRWLPGPSTRIVFTGLQLEAGSVTAVPYGASKNVLIYGDSITEGVLTLGGSQANDTDHNDVSVCWSYRQGPLLGAETGVIGFGATGLSRGGSGNVPALGVSFNQLWQGVPRSFSPLPDLIILNEGTNDGSNNITAPMIQVLNGLLAAAPGSPIAVLLPFDGAEASDLQEACDQCDNPSLCHFVDTTGFYNQTFGGGLHPTGPNDVARIAPQIAAKLRALL